MNGLGQEEDRKRKKGLGGPGRKESGGKAE